LFLAFVDNDNGISKAIASPTLESKHFLTVQKPMLGFQISYLIIGILPIMILLYHLAPHRMLLLSLSQLLI
jgi:hypothetical protein